MRIITSSKRTRRELRRAEIQAAVCGEQIDRSMGTVDKVINSKTAVGTQLRQWLRGPKKSNDRISRRFKK